MIVSPNGTKTWRHNEEGYFHRELDPAVILSDGTHMWYLNGKKHREDGPAIIWSSGTEEWFLNGKNLSFTEWADKLNLDPKTRLEMVLKWNPK